jgi:hypothetical protein
LANDGSPEARARWVVVVPLEDTRLFAYLTKSFASVPDVSVVLERRRGRSANEVTVADRGADERRAHPRVVSTFGCAVIRRPVPIAPAPVPPDPPASRPRTLLWPHLRITDVLTWTEEGAPRGIDAPPPKARAN